MHPLVSCGTCTWLYRFLIVTFLFTMKVITMLRSNDSYLDLCSLAIFGHN